MEPSVVVSNLSKNYAGEHALAGISFAAPRGCLFGMVGADGAGKTTLLRILTTLCNFDNGEVTVLMKDVVKDYLDLRKRIGYMPQKFSLYQDLTVRENLLFFADIFGVGKTERKERMDRLLSFSRLGPFQNRRSRDLSGGMKQKLALSCTLVHTPEILFLDEPTTGVDPVSRKEFWEILFDLKKQGHHDHCVNALHGRGPALRRAAVSSPRGYYETRPARRFTRRISVQTVFRGKRRRPPIVRA